MNRRNAFDWFLVGVLLVASIIDAVVGISDLAQGGHGFFPYVFIPAACIFAFCAGRGIRRLMGDL